MLRVYFGSKEKEIYNTEVYFYNQYNKNWVIDEFAKKVIADIDDSVVLGPDEIQNDIFGKFGCNELSAGVKTLLLIKNMPNKIFNISNCGDNCAKYILELAKDRDITVCLHHYMNFGDSFEIRVINDGKRKVITNPEELLLLSHEYVRKDVNHEG